MGGEKDSTKTRVEPIFDDLLARDATSQTWLPPLLRLVRPDVVLPPLGDLEDSAWGEDERGLAPPRSLLTWLVDHAAQLPAAGLASCSPEVQRLRRLLWAADPATCEKARALVDQRGLPSRAWYILEGHTYPDVYLQTTGAIVVIEGKRTEADVTRATTWMPVRHQLLRHLDAVWDQRAGRSVYALFIVEGEKGEAGVDVPDHWQHVCAETVDPSVLQASLPHRAPAERADMAKAYLGVTTWQEVCREFGIPWATLR
jgi:hypothetical protein